MVHRSIRYQAASDASLYVWSCEKAAAKTGLHHGCSNYRHVAPWAGLSLKTFGAMRYGEAYY